MSSTSLVAGQIVSQGTLRRYSTRENKWVEKFYVLYSATVRNASRLDWHDSETSYKKNPTVRKTLFVEEIQRIDLYTPTDKDEKAWLGANIKYTLKLQTYRSPNKAELLEAKNEAEANKWKSSITALVEAARTRSLQIRTAFTLDVKSTSDQCYQPHERASLTFDVEMDDTAAATLMDLYGHFKLVFSSHHVTLVKQSGEPVLNWEYCNVRRYGFGSDRFTLEGGHLAGSAQGLFIFKNCQGSAIRGAMEEKMRDYQLQQRQMKKDKQPQQHQHQQPQHKMPYTYVDVTQNSPVKPVGGSSTECEYVEASNTPSVASSGMTSPVTPSSRTPSMKPTTKPKPKPKKTTSIESNHTTNVFQTAGYPRHDAVSPGPFSRTSSTSSDTTNPPPSGGTSSKSSNDDGYTTQTHTKSTLSPTTTASSHRSLTQSKSGPDSAVPFVKMSHILGQLNHAANDGRIRPVGNHNKMDFESSNTYDCLDLLAASKARTNFSLDSGVGFVEGDAVDPALLYGSILKTGSGPAVVESEYAEVGARL